MLSEILNKMPALAITELQKSWKVPDTLKPELKIESILPYRPNEAPSFATLSAVNDALNSINLFLSNSLAREIAEALNSLKMVGKQAENDGSATWANSTGLSIELLQQVSMGLEDQEILRHLIARINDGLGLVHNGQHWLKVYWDDNILPSLPPILVEDALQTISEPKIALLLSQWLERESQKWIASIVARINWQDEVKSQLSTCLEEMIKAIKSAMLSEKHYLDSNVIDTVNRNMGQIHFDGKQITANRPMANGLLLSWLAVLTLAFAIDHWKIMQNESDIGNQKKTIGDLSIRYGKSEKLMENLGKFFCEKEGVCFSDEK